MEKVRIGNSPKVSLVGSWGSERLIAALLDVLYKGVPLEEAIRNVREETIERRIGAFFKRGHWSTFEFIGAQFLVECSRACHLQFVRHRIASYWAESQRYVDYTKKEIRFIVPTGFPEEPLKKAYEEYSRLREKGYSSESARLVLPNATAVRFAAQMNARELLFNFVPQRCALPAQAEIRHVCWQMFAYSYKLWPYLSQLVWEELPNLHRDFCTGVPKGEDCRLYAIRDAEVKFGPLPEKPWTKNRNIL
jgi:thymidylate synthase (FAD)